MNSESLRGDNPPVRVLCGGEGSEREVSLKSGAAIFRALSGMFSDVKLIELIENRLPDENELSGSVVISALHGKYGEDGFLAWELERMNIAYAGSGPAASALSYDKLASLALAEMEGIAVAKNIYLGIGTSADFEELSATLGTPFVLKPRWDGSSVGLYIISSRDEWLEVEGVVSSSDYIAEAFVPGMDITVGILDGEALGVVGIRPTGGVYDYEHKYTPGKTVYDLPAQISQPIQERARGYAEIIFAMNKCRDFARVDFRVTAEGKLSYLEINTMPGMTETSLLPKSASLMNLTFDNLVERMILPAIRRRNEKER